MNFPSDRIYKWKKIKKMLAKAELVAEAEGDGYAKAILSSFKNVSASYTENLDTALALITAAKQAAPKGSPFRDLYTILSHTIRAIKGDNVDPDWKPPLDTAGSVLKQAYYRFLTQQNTILGNYEEAYINLKATWGISSSQIKAGDLASLTFLTTMLITCFIRLRTERDASVRFVFEFWLHIFFF